MHIAHHDVGMVLFCIELQTRLYRLDILEHPLYKDSILCNHL